MRRETLLSTRGFALLIGVFFQATGAYAMVGSKLDMNSVSRAEAEQVKSFINQDVRADLNSNLMERIHTLSTKTAFEPPMSQATEDVLIQGAYLALSQKSIIPINEQLFNRKMEQALSWLRTHGLLPHAITVGVLARKTWGEGYTAGFNYGAEMNFYLQGGKLKMTNYLLRGGQIGVGMPVADVEYYVAFCFGSCFGGDPNGWYLGTDMDISGGVGAGFFAEIGIDVSTLYQKFYKEKTPVNVADLYDAATFYLGFGLDVGIDAEAAMGLYRYNQLGPERTLADLAQSLDPKVAPGLISAQAKQLKP